MASLNGPAKPPSAKRKRRSRTHRLRRAPGKRPPAQAGARGARAPSEERPRTQGSVGMKAAAAIGRDEVVVARMGEAPAAIHVAAAPGTDLPMQVVMAAEVLRRVKRTRHCVSLVSQVIIRAYEEEALYAEVCRHLVAYGGYLMAWIGLAEEQPERVIRPVAHEGLEANFLGALRITWNNDLTNRSPTSRAIQEQRPHVARNILREPRFAVLRKEAQLNGYTATCALPLQFAQYGMGVLTIHAMEPDAFNAEEVSLLRELANDLSAGVIGLRERGKRQVLEEQLAAVIDAADDAIIGTDLTGRITQWNEGAARMFGHARSQAMGLPLVDLIVPPDQLEAENAVRDAVGRGERPGRFETMRRCKEGRLIRTSVTVSPILGGGGSVVGMTTIEHDVTAARLTEAAKRARALSDAEADRLRELERVRKTFLSEASHELKTPLTPLRLSVEALAAPGALSPQAVANHVSVMHRNVLRLCRLVDDMLESSRLETGRFKLDVAPFPLGAVLADVVSSLGDRAARHGIDLRLATQVRPLVVEADRARVEQVLHNLVGNAISFTPDGGRIAVSARREAGEAVVRVADSGIGFSAEQRPKLFQPFSRPHEGLGSAPKGTGLGLFISKGIIEQHGGRIWAESDGADRGATFGFALPVAGANADAPPPQEGVAGEGGATDLAAVPRVDGTDEAAAGVEPAQEDDGRGREAVPLK